MKITKQRLKIILESMILNEGQVEDLLAVNPQLGPAVDAGIKNPNHLKWLLRMEKFEPIADMVGLIPAFIQNKQRLVIKDLDLYRNPNDLRTALEALGESEGDKRRQLKDNETDVVYNDEQWLVVMPHTMESSIQWGKGTTWCTAATKTRNLFYSYVGRKNEDIVLFYAIRRGVDSKLDPNAKLSVGFLGGKPVVDGKVGGLTVNASNDGLTESSLKEIFDSKFDIIMSAITSHSEKIEGKHPAKKAMQKIALSKNPNILDKYTFGMNLKEKNDFIKILLDYDLSVEMSSLLARDKDKNVRSSVALSPNTPPEVLTLLARDEDRGVRAYVATNPNSPLELFTLLARDEDKNVRAHVATNPNSPPELFTLLARDEDKNVRSYVATNPNSPPEVLTLLARDTERRVRSLVAANRNTPLELLTQLARDKNKEVRAHVATNPNSPPEVLTLLARDEDKNVRSYVATNPNSPPEVLTLLARDTERRVRSLVATNPDSPLELFTLLARDEDKNVRAHVDRNPTYQKYLESQKQLNERWIKLAGLTKRKLA